jgi:hypothetical protein
MTDAFIFVSLHTGPPGQPTDSLSNEVTYKGYSRIKTHRNTDWDLQQLPGKIQVTNKICIEFAEVVIPSLELITHLALSDSSGKVLYPGPLYNTLFLCSPVHPNFTPGSICVTEFDSVFRTQSNVDQAKLWKYEGRCPNCGFLGRLDVSGGACCPLHGAYPMEITSDPRLA